MHQTTPLLACWRKLPRNCNTSTLLFFIYVFFMFLVYSINFQNIAIPHFFKKNTDPISTLPYSLLALISTGCCPYFSPRPLPCCLPNTLDSILLPSPKPSDHYMEFNNSIYNASWMTPAPPSAHLPGKLEERGHFLFLKLLCLLLLT